MCTYIECVKRHKERLEKQIQQESATASAFGAVMEMDTESGQPSGTTTLSGGGECNVQFASMPDSSEKPQMVISSTTTNQQYKSFVCSTCGICWGFNQYTHGCEECGGFALTRPCPICSGKCGAVWNREIDMSHEMKSSFWDGTCRLSQAEQQAHMLNIFVNDDMDTLIDAMSDLGRS